MTPDEYLLPAEHKWLVLPVEQVRRHEHALVPGEQADVGPAPESLETGKCTCGISLCRDSEGLWQSFGWPDLARSWADFTQAQLLASQQLNAGVRVHGKGQGPRVVARDCRLSDFDSWCFQHKRFHFLR